jgi:lipopolysaccharide export system permease protein
MLAFLISGFLRSNVTPREVCLNFLLEIPSYIGKIFPISSFMASLFCLNKLRNSNELTALFSLGMSRKKFVLVLLHATCLVALAQYIIAAYGGPWIRGHRHLLISDADRKFSNLRSKGLLANTVGSGKIWYKTKDYFLSFASFDRRKNSLEQVQLYYYDEHYHLAKKISAAHLQYLAHDQWQLQDAEILEQLNENNFPLLRHLDQQNIILNEQPEDLIQIQSDITTLFPKALWNYIQNLKNAGINTSEYEVVFFEKISLAILCFLFALLSSTGIFHPNRRGSSFGRAVALVFTLTILYWLAQSYLAKLGQSDELHPLLACFLIPGILTAYITWYYHYHRVLR